jgi:hypothetical protein
MDGPFEVGDRKKIRTTFTNDTGTPTSPTVLAGEYRKPSGTAAVPLTPSDLGSGVVEMTLPTFDEAGIWTWYIAGTAGVIAADQGFIKVVPKLTAI